MLRRERGFKPREQQEFPPIEAAPAGFFDTHRSRLLVVTGEPRGGRRAPSRPYIGD